MERCITSAWSSRKLRLNFFWSGKRDLVSRTVVVQSPLFGGFSVVDVKLKVLVPPGSVGEAFSFIPVGLGFLYVVLVSIVFCYDSF